MSGLVLLAPPPKSVDSLAYYESKLRFETDCSDIHAALGADGTDFVLLDVRNPRLYAKGHVPTAFSLPHSEIDSDALKAWPEDGLFVVYCAGPHCNGADKAAARLAGLGRRVKLMIGGMFGWIYEGFPVISGTGRGSLISLRGELAADGQPLKG